QTRASSSSIRAGLAGRAGVMDGGGDEPGDSIRSRRAGLAEGRPPSCRGSLRFDTAMPASLIDFLAGGLLQFGFWQLALYLLVATQLTIFAVTLYLHRSQAHRGVDFHPVIAHFFRFWTWLTTSMSTREWVAIHRKHHAKCETEEDPHSPQFKGIKTVFWRGVELYREARGMRDDIEQYGKGAPSDWIERHLYTPY